MRILENIGSNLSREECLERFLKEQTLMLKREVEEMERSLETLSDEEDSIYHQERYLFLVIDSYSGIYEHVLRNLAFFKQKVDNKLLRDYFLVMREFDILVSKFDPDWPSG